MLRVFLELALAGTLCSVNVTVQCHRTRHFALLGDVCSSRGEEEANTEQKTGGCSNVLFVAVDLFGKCKVHPRAGHEGPEGE